MLDVPTNSHVLRIAFLLIIVAGTSTLWGRQLFSRGSRAARPNQILVNKARGIDVSHYQGKVRWDLMAPDSIHFAFVKATGGMTFVDPEFSNNWHGSREAGVIRGAYHFFYAKDDPNAQAQLFLQTVVGLKDTDLPPVLDVEITDGASKEELLEGVIGWLKIVEQKLGRRPLIYCGHTFANEYLTDERLRGYSLWIADYEVPAPVLPNLWKNQGWKFWQHSQKGTLEGMGTSVDLNVFNGSLDDLQKFIRAYQIR